jgi:dGTPase
VPRATWALAEADGEFALDLATWPSLEAQIAAIADDIAYDNHDVDDGLRSGLFTLEDLFEVPLVARSWAAVKSRYPGVADDRLLAELVRDQIGLMVNDVLDETRSRIAAAGVETADDVRHAGRALAGFSERLASEERALKSFLYRRMYNAPAVTAVRIEAQKVIANLAAAFRTDPRLLPDGWRPPTDDPTATMRRIGDYIAGMTDRFAIKCHEQLIGRVALPEGF